MRRQNRSPVAEAQLDAAQERQRARARLDEQPAIEPARHAQLEDPVGAHAEAKGAVLADRQLASLGQRQRSPDGHAVERRAVARSQIAYREATVAGADLEVP